MTSLRRTALTLALATVPLGTAHAFGLAGSPASMLRQHEIAVHEDYSFLRTPGDVQHLVDLGGLVMIESGEHYSLSGVSFPYARPAIQSFIQHFAVEYADSTGHPLVITSLTRPEALQPANAHRLSVHPAGMAVDFRVPALANDRAFLERALLGFEKAGLLDVTREHTPAHYHVAVFPEQYVVYAARLDSITAANAPAPVARAVEAGISVASNDDSTSSTGTPLARMLLMMLSLVGLAIPAVRQPKTARVRARRERATRPR